MTPAKWIGELFRGIDANDTEEFLSYLTHDALFRFGNAPLCTGRWPYAPPSRDFSPA